MANLIVTTSINITLEGEPHIFENIQTLTGVTDLIDSPIQVPLTEVSIVSVAAENAGATFKDINFIYLENKDTVNFCTIGYKNTGGDTVYFKLLAGRSKYLWTNELEVSESGAAFSAFADWDTVTGQFDTTAGILKVFACQVTT